MKYWKEAASLILAAGQRSSRRTPIQQTVVIPQQAGYPNPVFSGGSSGSTARSNLAPVSGILSQCRGSFGTTDDVEKGKYYNLCNDDYSILMLRRTQTSSSFAGAEVFPGGCVDDADFSPDWLELFNEAGIKSNKDFGQIMTVHGPRPYILTVKRDSLLPSEIAFRICAIRETFEEAGVLLLKSLHNFQKQQTEKTFGKNCEPPGFSYNDIDINHWRKRVHNDATQFLVLCRELHCIPDVWALMEWSNWLTPVHYEKKRYDTMFFLCCMEDKPVAKHDEQEIVRAKWSSACEIIQAIKKAEINLLPPQIYELSRINHFKTLQDLFAFSSSRSCLGCERWLPVLYSSKDARIISTYPGDDLYPPEPQVEGVGHKMPVLDKTSDDLINEATHLNRMVFINANNFTLHYNITSPCGHLAPTTCFAAADDIKSKL